MTAWRGRRSGGEEGAGGQLCLLRRLVQPLLATLHQLRALRAASRGTTPSDVQPCPTPPQDVPARPDVLLAGPPLPVRFHPAGGWRARTSAQPCGCRVCLYETDTAMLKQLPRCPCCKPTPTDVPLAHAAASAPDPMRRQCGCWAAPGCCWAWLWRSACSTCWTSCEDRANKRLSSCVQTMACPRQTCSRRSSLACPSQWLPSSPTWL